MTVANGRLIIDVLISLNFPKCAYIMSQCVRACNTRVHVIAYAKQTWNLRVIYKTRIFVWGFIPRKISASFSQYFNIADVPLGTYNYKQN